MENKKNGGHVTALITILMWGTTFISTKVLLADFHPVEILLFRFLMGFALLLVICPRRIPKTTVRQELCFAAAGLCGVCLYYLLENIALTYTMAANVSVIVSASPFFTAILGALILKEEKLHPRFFLGFVVAMAGICLISFHGAALSLSPAGDLLSLLAAIAWAFYSILTKKISGFGIHTLLATRRIFLYGILFMIPAALCSDFHWSLHRFSDPTSLFNLLFLGLGASALGFVFWNFAVCVLGPVKTSIYLYMIPVITVVTSALILREKITALSAIGTLLTLTGLFLSEKRRPVSEKNRKSAL